MVKTTAFPASPAVGVYTGVNEFIPEVIAPVPFSVQKIEPLLYVAPLTVAVATAQIVCEARPEILALGFGSIDTEYDATSVGFKTEQVLVVVTVIVNVTVVLVSATNGV
jgi:hypothetical protein